MGRPPIPPKPRNTWTYRVGAQGTRVLCRLAGGFTVHGREHLPSSGGGILCANHVSYLDPPVLGAAVYPRRTYFMAKKELFDIPLLGKFIHNAYAFPVDREGNDRQAIRFAVNLLQQGELLVVFPEGQRSPDGSLQPGNLGPALMASKAGTPIIPIALKDTDKVLPRHGKFLHRGHVSVDIGKPIDPREYGDERPSREQLAAITERLMSAIYDLQQVQYQRAGQTAPPRVKELSHAE